MKRNLSTTQKALRICLILLAISLVAGLVWGAWLAHIVWTQCLNAPSC